MKTTINVAIKVETSNVEETYIKKENITALLFQAGYNADVSIGEIEDNNIDNIVVPESFGMFSKAGNNLFISRAKKLVEKLKKNPENWQGYFNWYLDEYEYLCNKVSKHAEMTDTDVREQVYGFLFKVSDSINNDIVERNERAKFLAQHRRRK